MAKSGKYTIKTREFIIEPKSEDNLWDCEWDITLRATKFTDDVVIGTASFSGEKAFGTIPLTVKLDSEYQNKKHGTEVFKLMSDFALGFKNIYEVEAKTEDENYKCIYALEKAGFVLRQKEHHTEIYSITKPRTTWLGLYLFIGVVTGLMLGFVVGSSWVGLCIGLFLGVLFGAAMDTAANKEREKVTGKKKNDK